MKKNQHQFRSHCPINFAQELFGDKWSLLIIRDLMFAGKRYYGEFLKSEEKISTNILASRLDNLEAHGLVTKSLDESNRSKYIYKLTKKGMDLLPLLMETIAWSAKYDKDTATPKRFLKRYRDDREGFLRELREEVSRNGNI